MWQNRETVVVVIGRRTSGALHLNNAGATSCRMDDFPESRGITHASVVIDGLKLYMCGGYVWLFSANSNIRRRNIVIDNSSFVALPSKINLLLTDLSVAIRGHLLICAMRTTIQSRRTTDNGQWNALPKLPIERSSV
jgi:hypothetical protein